MKHLAAWAMTVALSLATAAAAAQFKDAPAVARATEPMVSTAETPAEYKKDVARHIYTSYSSRVRKGKLEPLLYGVAIVDTDVDAAGNVLNVTLRRPPAAAEVGPWIVRMIQGASPLPVPARMGPGKFTEIWLVEKAGTFQLDTLSEGQR